MKNVAFTAVVLCSLWIGCIEKEPAPANLWRSLEPRLTTTTEWQQCEQDWTRKDRAVRQQCLHQPPPSDKPCSTIRDRATAEVVLRTQPQCTDDAVAAFERFARVDPRVHTDLAAAYYVRAQRDDSVRDLLSALEAAEAAVKATPNVPAAHFNLALALQELALYGRAMESWTAFLALEPAGKWAEEARAHRNRIAPLRPEVMETEWARLRAKIPAALQARDAEKLLQLIAMYPQSALLHFEDDLFPAWAAEPTPENIARARVYATALSRRYAGDAMPLEMVNTLARAIPSPEKLAALQKAYKTYEEARGSSPASLAKWDEAAALFRFAGSPYARVVEQNAIATGWAYLLANRSADVKPMLEEALKDGYLSLATRLHSTKGLIEWGSGSYVQALDDYEGASALIARTKDHESRYDNLLRMSGVTGLAGVYDVAFEQALEAVRNPRLIDVRNRHLALGEASRQAHALNRHYAAWRYQTEAVTWLRAHERNPDGWRLNHNLATALRDLADIEFQIGETKSGTVHLVESIKRFKKSAQVPTLKARIKEVEARSVMESNPRLAIRHLSAAIELAARTHDTYRASLFAQRAAVHRSMGNLGASEKDMRWALDVVHEEEARELAARDAGGGGGEETWSAYFSRFKDTYSELILRLVEKGDSRTAFHYVERSRAAEPLDLISRRSDTPPEFGAILARPTIAVADLQKHLPKGTFVLEYSVFDDHTIVWILSSDHFKMLRLSTRRETIEAWGENIQRALRRGDISEIDDQLIAPYAELFLPALRRIEQLHGGKARRLAIVADESMRGIPLLAARHPVTHERLIQYAPLSFPGSATLYVYSILRSNALWTSEPRSMLLIGDPLSRRARERGLGPLRFALLEVFRIEAAHDGKTTTLIGKDATVQNFVAQATHHQIIHYAGHSEVNREKPYLSVLYLASTPKHDGMLTARDLIKSLKLEQTTLFVMSSCEGTNDIPTGPEGVAPLVRPVIGAGVPAVIGARWNVDDATTEPLLVSFYDEYRRSGDAAASLQKVQVAMLHDTNAWRRSVLAWGAFQLIGDTAPPQTASTTKTKEKPP
jgi:CHAT domain-containing protein